PLSCASREGSVLGSPLRGTRGPSWRVMRKRSDRVMRARRRGPYLSQVPLGARGGRTRRMAMASNPIVFVVDTDVAVRESLESLIARGGWQPKTFSSAKEFLAQPRVPGPSCMVLDVALPGLSGLDLQKLVANRTDMPVIFLTGHGDVEMTVQAMKAGALEFLTKPFRSDVLGAAIAEALEPSRAALAREPVMKALRHTYSS